MQLPTPYEPVLRSLLANESEQRKFFKKIKKDIFGPVLKKSSADVPLKEFLADTDSDQEVKKKSLPKLDFNNLHMLSKHERKRLNLREYVDMKQDEELAFAVRNLLYKLKELYFIRKTKPQKGKYKK